MCNTEQALSYFRQVRSQINTFDNFKQNKNGLFFEYQSNIKLLEILTCYQPNLREILKRYSSLISVQSLSKSIHNDRYLEIRQGIDFIIYQLKNGYIKPVSLMKLFLEKVDIKPSINIAGLVSVELK